MVRWLIVLAVLPAICVTGHAFCSETKKAVECVILLHGLGRTSRSMEKMAQALEGAGYHTVNIDYPSREFPIEQLAEQSIPQALQQCHAMDARSIYFVTHSMGGILVRYYLTKKAVRGLGRVVMLSPPNKGSEVTDALHDTAFYQWFNGPAGQQLGTGPGSFVVRLGPVDYPVGIITGNAHAMFDSWLADLIPGPNDGKVSVERAKVDGMTDFLVLPYAHPFIMEEDEVIEQTVQFLRHGKFKHEGAGRKP